MSTLRFVLRQIGRRPGFAAIVILTLALGIGASTLIFTVVDGVLLEPLPYPGAQRIVRVFETNDVFDAMNVTDPNFVDFQAQSRSFAAFAQVESDLEAIVGGDEPARLRRALVSREFFDVFGTQPSRGRAFLPEELRSGAAPAAIVSHGYWQRYLGGTPDLAGRTLKIAGQTHAIVGVMPPGFDFPGGTDVWTPRELWPFVASRTSHSLAAYGRLAAGVSVERAGGELGAIARRLKTEYGGDMDMSGVRVLPLRDVVLGDVRPTLLALGAAVALLLVVASINATGLLLTRAVTREREIAVRVALGAGARSLVVQFLAEAGVLGAGACVLGLLLAAWGADAAAGLAHAPLPRIGSIGVDWRAAAFAAALALLIALASSLVVAWRAFAVDLVRSASRGGDSSPKRTRLRDGLVAAQVALALVLAIGATLLGRSFLALAQVEPGFRTEGVLFMELGLQRTGIDAREPAPDAFLAALMDRLRSLPGVETVGGAFPNPPLAGGGWDGTFVVQSSAGEVTSLEEFAALSKNPARSGYAEYRIVSEDYFAALDIPLLRGRLFAPSDAPGNVHAAVISQALADRRWPNEDPLGKLVQFGNMDGDLTPFRVVGVVGDVRDRGLEIGPRATLYGYYRQRASRLAAFTIALRARDAAGLVPLARGIVRGMNPDLAPEFRTASSLRGAVLAPQRFNLALVAAFGGASLLLALTGIYGAMAFSVAQRRREIGVRIALGATGSSVVGLVVRRSVAIVGIGVAAGLLLALAGARLIASLLFDIAPYDPAAFAAATTLLVCAALAAAWVPARHAAAVDPIGALREE